MKKIIGVALLWAFTLSAQATIFQYSVTNPSGNHNAGQVTSIDTSFNTSNNVWSWSHSINDAGSNSSDGFWLVISDGENPKSNVSEYAIFYGDADAGLLTAYEYSGQNNAGSWSNPGNFLGSFSMNYSHSAGVGTFDWSIDVTSINNFYNTSDWDGAEFGNQLGYWFHPFLNGDFQYAQDGSFSAFSHGTQGWYDKKNLQTTMVPEPAIVFLMATGILGIGASRRRKF